MDDMDLEFEISADQVWIVRSYSVSMDEQYFYPWIEASFEIPRGQERIFAKDGTRRGKVIIHRTDHVEEIDKDGTGIKFMVLDGFVSLKLVGTVFDQLRADLEGGIVSRLHLRGIVEVEFMESDVVKKDTYRGKWDALDWNTRAPTKDTEGLRLQQLLQEVRKTRGAIIFGLAMIILLLLFFRLHFVVG
jgi:hypothetical protein